MTESKMLCEACNAEMNFHAVKLDLTRVPDSFEGDELDWEGILEEFHTCPECGTTAARDGVTAR